MLNPEELEQYEAKDKLTSDLSNSGMLKVYEENISKHPAAMM